MLSCTEFTGRSILPANTLRNRQSNDATVLLIPGCRKDRPNSRSGRSFDGKIDIGLRAAHLREWD